MSYVFNFLICQFLNLSKNGWLLSHQVQCINRNKPLKYVLGIRIFLRFVTPITVIYFCCWNRTIEWVNGSVKTKIITDKTKIIYYSILKGRKQNLITNLGIGLFLFSFPSLCLSIVVFFIIIYTFKHIFYCKYNYLTDNFYLYKIVKMYFQNRSPHAQTTPM